MQTIYVPTIRDSRNDYYSLFDIWRLAVNSPHGAVFDFTKCTALHPNAVAFLGGVVRLCQHYGKTVQVDWLSVQPQVLLPLCQNGFALMFGRPIRPWAGEHLIPYREDTISAANPVCDYLSDEWLGKGWISISDSLRDGIVGKVWEIYANSFEHAQSPIGVFSCGEHFNSTNELILSVVDFGTGIPSKIRDFLKLDPRLTTIQSSALLRWACIQGNTTVTDVPRGMGLNLLKEFVKVNNGSLEIYSEDSYAIMDKNGEQYHDLPKKFNGTIVSIKLICDARFYRFAHEPSSQ